MERSYKDGSELELKERVVSINRVTKVVKVVETLDLVLSSCWRRKR